ncbi:MAG: D-2-hydroxyacid dehydrogenase [Phycisphaerae bacterium]|nr:D-2-hydroxyacid dehydrogenase [Phycisphaerae bacterium]
MKTPLLMLLAAALIGCTSPGPTVARTTPLTQPTLATTEEVGSSRNARIAVLRAKRPAQLTYFAREMTSEERVEVEQLAPHLTIVVGLSREDALSRAAEANGVDASYATPEFLQAAKNLVWVQAQSAGVDRYLTIPELATEEIVLTNMRGVHGPAIADHAFAMLLVLTRDLPTHLEGRTQGKWQREGSGVLTPDALTDKTLLVVGLGGIGTEIARRGHGFGMHVIATRRSAEPVPDFVERVGKPEDLLTLLPQADVVAIAVPLTPTTTGMFDQNAFNAMKPGSYLINIARGKVVDTGALIEVLASGHLGGACLDVTDPEPLPPDSPLWKFPNVVITPHVASRAEATDVRAWALFRENLRRFDAGEPLLNVVDRTAGY